MSYKLLQQYINNPTVNKPCLLFTDAKGNIITIHIFDNTITYNSQNITPQKTPTGYPYVPVYLKATHNNPTDILVHQLVAVLVHGNQSGSNLQICHKNGNKEDFRPCNLEWGTSEQNREHSKMLTAMWYTSKNYVLKNNNYSYKFLKDKFIENKHLDEFFILNPDMKNKRGSVKGNSFIKFMFEKGYWK